MDRQAKTALLAIGILAVILVAGFAFAGPNTRSVAACKDGADNDADGLTDWPNDPGCSSRNDADENNCGDAAINGNEACDGTDLGGQTCSSQGFSGGTLSCNSACTGFVTSSCTNQTCGNNIIEGNEACDGTQLNNQSCQTQGFVSGTLSCDSACTGFVTSSCTNQTCGNNIAEGSETCDGTDLKGASCTSLGFSGGALGCASACGAYDTTGCYTNTCADTDWLDRFTAGFLNGTTNNTPFFHADSCLNSTMVTEWYCSGTTPASVDLDCNLNITTSCQNGACV